MLALQGFQFSVEGVILGVGDLRRVIDMVAAVVVADLLAQILYPAPNVYASGHAGIIRTDAPAPKGCSITNAEHAAIFHPLTGGRTRSEERRVGKECRS